MVKERTRKRTRVVNELDVLGIEFDSRNGRRESQIKPGYPFGDGLENPS